MDALYHDSDPFDDTPRTVACFDREADPERMYYALAEVGLEPSESGGGFFVFDRHLTEAEFALVNKAETLAI